MTWGTSVKACVKDGGKIEGKAQGGVWGVYLPAGEAAHWNNHLEVLLLGLETKGSWQEESG
jgi:hypothetical protein